MNDLESARTRWIEERAQHAAFAKVLGLSLKSILQPLGIWFDVSHRAKEIDSLLKKLIRKPIYTYESLPDKVGLRIVVRYRTDIPRVLDLVKASFDCGDPDDKAERLGEDRVGYQSRHLDHLTFLATDPHAADFPAIKFWAELQIRTLAQHLWSEMSHDTIYKNDETFVVLPADYKRRVNLMAGQIEVADREFDRLGTELPPEDSLEILRFLEHEYYMLSSNRPDTELSAQVLRRTLPLYNADARGIEQILTTFLERKRATLVEIYSQVREGEAIVSTPFLFQPEVLVLYERLTNDPVALRRAWNEYYPDGELERIANTFGISFD